MIKHVARISVFVQVGTTTFCGALRRGQSLLGTSHILFTECLDLKGEIQLSDRTVLSRQKPLATAGEVVFVNFCYPL